MDESFVRHAVSFIGTLVALLAFWAGYVSGGNGWWWAGFAVFIIYFAIYQLMEV
jgi:hypothetical protein